MEPATAPSLPCAPPHNVIACRNRIGVAFYSNPDDVRSDMVDRCSGGSASAAAHPDRDIPDRDDLDPRN
jgi:hypothetical protein